MMKRIFIFLFLLSLHDTLHAQTTLYAKPTSATKPRHGCMRRTESLPQRKSKKPHDKPSLGTSSPFRHPIFFLFRCRPAQASPLRSEASRALRSRAKKSETHSNWRLKPPQPTRRVQITPAFHSLFQAPAGSKTGSTPVPRTPPLRGTASACG